MARSISMYKMKGSGIGTAKLVAPNGRGPSYGQKMPSAGGIARGANASTGPSRRTVGRSGMSYYFASGVGTAGKGVKGP